MLQTVIALAQPWADYYSDHRAVSTAILTVHLLAMFVGGGIALATDRTILRVPANRPDAARQAATDMADTHRVVIGSLVLVILSGLLLFLADVTTFAGSAVYWGKMSAFVLLLLNGLRMQRAETAMLQGHGLVSANGDAATATPMPTTAWRTLVTTARISLILWMAILILGVVLTNA